MDLLTSLLKRKQILLAIKSGLVNERAAFLSALYADLAKPEGEAIITEYDMILREIDFLVRNLPKLMAPKKIKQPLAFWGGHSTVEYQPRGRVLIFSAWNYPLQLAFSPLIGALSAGNKVVLKPSEIAVHCSAFLKKFFSHKDWQDKFDDCVTVIEGGVDIAQNLLTENFDFVFFTGSTEAGRSVLESCAKQLTPACLELGGSNPCIIREDADLSVAARRILWAKTMNAGQTCVAPNHIWIDGKVASDFTHILKQTLIQDYPLSGEKGSCIINDRHVQRILDYTQYLNPISQNQGPDYVHGIDDGRHLAFRIYSISSPSRENLRMIESTEIFGPVLPLLIYDNEEELRFRLSSNPSYPLAFYIFTKSKADADEWIQRLPFGGGCVNDCILHMTSLNLPFGGIRKSGQGAYHGKHSFYLFSHAKSIYKAKTFPDPRFRYPPYGRQKIKWIDWLMT